MSRNNFFVYLEQERSEVDGPFEQLQEMFDSPLWFRRRACFWRENYVPGRGWAYEHARRSENGWRITSKGLRPTRPYPPAALERVLR